MFFNQVKESATLKNLLNLKRKPALKLKTEIKLQQFIADTQLGDLVPLYLHTIVRGGG